MFLIKIKMRFQLFISHHDSLMNFLAWTIKCKWSIVHVGSIWVWCEGLRSVWKGSFSHSHHYATFHSHTACLTWYDAFTGCLSEIPGCWPYSGEVNLFTWTSDNLWLSLYVAMNEPVNRMLLWAANKTAHQEKGERKALVPVSTTFILFIIPARSRGMMMLKGSDGREWCSNPGPSSLIFYG